MNDALSTPWSRGRGIPALPPRTGSGVDASASPLGLTRDQVPTPLIPPMSLDTPWQDADIRLPARATALPSLALGPVLPSPRATSDAVVDLDQPTTSTPQALA